VKLTEKQKRFCDYYIETGNATESYLKAGYRVKTDGAARANASRLLTNANVKSYIEQKLKELEDKRIAKAEEVLKYLTSVMRGEETEEVVVVEGLGEGMSSATTIKKQVGARERIKAAELLGKRYALFTEKLDVNEPISITIKRKGD
jgi:phage terminase small subunit